MSRFFATGDTESETSSESENEEQTFGVSRPAARYEKFLLKNCFAVVGGRFLLLFFIVAYDDS